MKFRDDDRAVTVQIGAVLLFGILIISMATYQVTVVPAENKAVEFQQSQETQRQLQDLRNAIVRSGSGGAREPVSVTLGTDYPTRALFINPPPATGTLRTAGTNDSAVNLSITGAVAMNADAREYWNGSAHTYDTGFVVYEPSFNEYRNAPTTVYEHTVLANTFESGRALPLSGQSLLDGRRINLVALDGTMSETKAGSTVVNVRPLSASENTIAVRNETSPIVLRFGTQLTEDAWRTLLANEPHVQNWSYTNGTPSVVRVELEPDVTYELDASLVGVGAVRDSSPEATYLVSVDGFDKVQNGSRGTVTVQVRDDFNNPVSDVRVNATTGGNLTLSDSQVISDERGYATFEYEGTQVTDNATITVTIEDGSPSYEKIRYTNGSITQTDEGAVNAPSGDILFDSASIDGTNDDLTHIYLNNTADRNISIKQVRVNFYYETQPSQYDYARLSNATGGKTSKEIYIAGKFVELDDPIVLPKNEVTEALLHFYPTSAKINNAEYFIVTIRYSTGEEDVYYIQPS